MTPRRGDGEENPLQRDREGGREGGTASTRGISRHDKSNDVFVPREGEGEAAQTKLPGHVNPGGGQNVIKVSSPTTQEGT